MIAGPDKGLEVTIEGRPLSIGKGEGCDLKLSDESVSRSHASISPTAEGHLLEDLQSTNGTEVNGVVVKSALLTPGCRIQMGETTLEFTPLTRKLPSVPLVYRDKIAWTPSGAVQIAS